MDKYTQMKEDIKTKTKKSIDEQTKQSLIKQGKDQAISEFQTMLRGTTPGAPNIK